MGCFADSRMVYVYNRLRRIRVQECEACTEDSKLAADYVRVGKKCVMVDCVLDWIGLGRNVPE
jgi:hypothetical protein